MAQGIASAKGFTVILLRVVGDSEELSAEESYMRDRVGVFRAPMRFLISPDPAAAIIGKLENNPQATAALTTHGRTAWGEALLGNMALKRYQAEPNWDVLHGEAGDAICRYVNGRISSPRGRTAMDGSVKPGHDNVGAAVP